MSRTPTMHDAGGAPGSGRPAASPAESIAGTVHDLGNLIQIASAAVNIVARNPSVQTAGLEPVLIGAKTSLERAGALVRQTVGTARERSGAVGHVSLGTCLTEVETLFQSIPERDILLEVQAGSDLPMVKCDPLALQNAVLNLLFNARDAMPTGGVISICAEVILLGPGVTGIELRVTDNGVGMKPDTILRAFDLFFTTKCDGLGGFGLPMVERFARNCGGRVLIESQYGAGTTVTLQLPASPP